MSHFLYFFDTLADLYFQGLQMCFLEKKVRLNNDVIKAVLHHYPIHLMLYIYR